MGIASLILGIISLAVGWIPFICFICLILAVIGLILGIVDTVKKNKAGIQINKTITSIVGLIICAIAIPVIVFSSIFSIILFAGIAYSRPSEYDNGDIDYYDNGDEFYNYYWDSIFNNKIYNSISYEEKI